MSFINPQFFLVLIVPFIIFAFLISTNKDRLSRIFDKEVLERLSATDESMPMVVRNFLMFIALFLMIIAMARPVIIKGDKTVEIEGLTMLTALDISGSMRSEDIYPNRLTFAKKKMGQFFDSMPSDEIGVMAFAYSSFVVAPFSSDKEILKMMIDGVDDSYINMGSTDYLALGGLTSSLLEEKKPKILVIFSDGGDKKAIEGFTNLLKENNIELFVVLIGTTKGSPVLKEDGNPYTLKDGTIAITQRNDILGEIAKDNGGAFVVAGNGSEDMRKLASIIKAKYQKEKQGAITIKEQSELFYYPLGLGIFFLLISLSSMPRRKK